MALDSIQPSGHLTTECLGEIQRALQAAPVFNIRYFSIIDFEIISARASPLIIHRDNCVLRGLSLAKWQWTLDAQHTCAGGTNLRLLGGRTGICFSLIYTPKAPLRIGQRHSCHHTDFFPLASCTGTAQSLPESKVNLLPCIMPNSS